MSEFNAEISAIGHRATMAILGFMEDKAEWWVPGFPGIDSREFDEDELEEPDDDWPTFDNDEGDMCHLLGFNKDERGDLILHAILQMRHEGNQLTTIRVDDLFNDQACTIADSIPHALEPTPDPVRICLQNILNAHRNYDRASLSQYIAEGEELLRDPA